MSTRCPCFGPQVSRVFQLENSKIFAYSWHICVAVCPCDIQTLKSAYNAMLLCMSKLKNICSYVLEECLHRSILIISQLGIQKQFLFTYRLIFQKFKLHWLHVLSVTISNDEQTDLRTAI